MKKLVLSIMVVLSLLTASKANAQRLSFYYYPDANVYYDPGNRHYIYYDHGSWINVSILPRTIIVRNTPRVIVYSDRQDVWRMNDEHMRKYKHYPNGRAVGYKGSNPNKANGKFRHH